MVERSAVVLADLTFDEFVSFLFDRDVALESEGKDYWYWHVAVEFDAKIITAHYIRLFRQPEFLLERFTKVQLEEAFWAIASHNLDSSVSKILSNWTCPYPFEKNASAPWLRCLNAFSR